MLNSPLATLLGRCYGGWGSLTNTSGWPFVVTLLARATLLLYCHCLSCVQYKESETLMKTLKEERDTAQRTCDQQGQHILSLEANLSAADEKRRKLRKELAEVGGS